MGLKALVKKRFADKPQAEMALIEYRKDEDTWQKPLVDTGADQDKALVRQAQQVLKLVNPRQASQGKCNVPIGDHLQVTQTLGET